MNHEISHPAASFTVRLDARTLDALDRLVEKTDRSRSWLVSRAVEEFLTLNEWQIQKIENGLAAADRGDFASADDVAHIRREYALKPQIEQEAIRVL